MAHSKFMEKAVKKVLSKLKKMSAEEKKDYFEALRNSENRSDWGNILSEGGFFDKKDLDLFGFRGLDKNSVYTTTEQSQSISHDSYQMLGSTGWGVRFTDDETNSAFGGIRSNDEFIIEVLGSVNDDVSSTSLDMLEKQINISYSISVEYERTGDFNLKQDKSTSEEKIWMINEEVSRKAS